MRLTLLLVMTVAGAVICEGQETAYSALRAIKSQSDKAYLGRILRLTGNKGNPQPLIWRVVVDDSAARAGVREFEVSGGRIVSERTPIESYANEKTSLLDLKKVLMDSDAAFRFAVQICRERRVGFDVIDYNLAFDSRFQAPVWQLSLFDLRGGKMGELLIDAEKRKLLKVNQLTPIRESRIPTERAGERVELDRRYQLPHFPGAAS